MATTVLTVSVARAATDVAPAAQAANGQTRVLQGIPAIARAFAPVAGVKWEEFANVLAGICAVESNCNPTYGHRTQSGAWSQYQGLVQMNMLEVAKAEQALQSQLSVMQAAAERDPETKKAFEFVKKAMESARSMSGDRRFHPEYGMILGAAKHIQINGVLAKQYPGDPVRQAAGHMTAQFSSITESKIRSGQFGATISGDPWGNPVSSEAAALRVNKVVGGATVAGAIEASGRQWGAKMQAMMQKMSQVTNGLTTVPDNVAPFAGPDYKPGSGPMLNQPYNAVSSMMEDGYIKPQPAPAFPASSVPSIPQTSTNGVSQTSTGSTGTSVTSGSSTASSEDSVITKLLNAISGEEGEAPSGPPAAYMHVQSRTVAKRGHVVLSWVSVNMSARGCAVTRDSVVIANGKEGTAILAAAQLPSGDFPLELRCTAPDGKVYVQQDTVRIE